MPGEAELVSECTGMPGEEKSVKCSEQSNGPDTALYKNYRFFLTIFELMFPVYHHTLKIKIIYKLKDMF